MKLLIAISLVFAGFIPAQPQRAGCRAGITPVPFEGPHAPMPAGREFPKDSFIRYSYPVGQGYRLELYSVPDDFPNSDHGDRGLILMHGDEIVQIVSLETLPALASEDEDSRNNFEALSIAKTCQGNESTVFVAFGYRGDMTSGDLFLSLAHGLYGYRFANLPVVRGGVLEVSRHNVRMARTWDNLFEGSCDACLTRYRVSTFEFVDGHPRIRRSFRTRRLYSSDDALFDDRLRIHLIP